MAGIIVGTPPSGSVLTTFKISAPSIEVAMHKAREDASQWLLNPGKPKEDRGTRAVLLLVAVTSIITLYDDDPTWEYQFELIKA